MATILSEEDIKIVARQIGRIPKNIIRIVRRCSCGFPVVIESHSVLEGKPFPTVYWLTCPYLRYQISKLESNGGVKRFETLLSESLELYAKHVEAHLKASERAIELARNASCSVIERLSRCGMGGIADFKHVKCLHMHVAYHIGGIKNPVGEMVLSELKSVECDDCVCEKDTKEW